MQQARIIPLYGGVDGEAGRGGVFIELAINNYAVILRIVAESIDPATMRRVTVTSHRMMAIKS